MADIDKTRWRYIRQSLSIIGAMALLALLATRIWLLEGIMIPLLVSVLFALCIEFAGIFIWSHVAKKCPDNLPTFFMGVSGGRMLMAIGVMFIYFLLTDRENVLLPFGIFMAFYFAILIHHSLFFTVKNKR